MVREIVGERGSASLAPAPDSQPEAPPGSWLVRCFGEVDADLFLSIYRALVPTQRDGRLRLIVDMREARNALTYDGYEQAAAMLYRRGIRAIQAVICNEDAAGPLGAKVATEIAAIHGIAVHQRMAARIEDAGAILLALARELPGGTAGEGQDDGDGAL